MREGFYHGGCRVKLNLIEYTEVPRHHLVPVYGVGAFPKPGVAPGCIWKFSKAPYCIP